jgi:hypothetical protein
MIRVEQQGDFSATYGFLKRASTNKHITNLDNLGAIGVSVLRDATPKNSGETAESWDYEIIRTKNSVTINWINTADTDAAPVAILLQYGHGTRNGAFVEGIDYINPAMRPIFEAIADKAWKELTR